MRYLWLAVAILAMLLLRSAHANAPPAAQPPTGLGATARWQYGCDSAAEALGLLRLPAWHNWIEDDCGLPGHTKTAYSLHPKHLARYMVAASAGEYWLVGSEPNVQSTYVAPEDAAEFVRAWAAQTNVQWACCGTLQHWQHDSMLRWLDGYLAAGGAVGDAWHIHIYFVDAAGWDKTLAQFGAWMERNGVVRPVLVTETAQTSGDAEPLLRHVAQAVCNGRVQAAYWYGADEDYHDFAPTSQLTVHGTITPLGELFVELQVCAQVEPTAIEVLPQPMWRVWLPVVR